MSDCVMVRVKHVRMARLCTGGMREWLRLHGMDPMEMIRVGISADRLEATGDKFAMDVCKIARADARKDHE